MNHLILFIFVVCGAINTTHANNIAINNVSVKYRLKTNNIWYHAALNRAYSLGFADGHTEPILFSNIAIN
jgi:hypothetical protein